MIVFKPRNKVRNEETIQKLKDDALGPQPTDPEKIIERACATIATQMAMIDGGKYRVQIELPAGLVAVIRS